MKNAFIISSVVDDPHKASVYGIMTMDKGHIMSEDEIHKTLACDTIKIWTNVLTREDAEDEMRKILERLAREYTELLRALPDLSVVKDRHFLVYLDDEITYFPGAYSVNFDQYNRLVQEFTGVRLANVTDTFYPIIMVKDLGRIRKLDLTFGTYFATASEVISEARPFVYDISVEAGRILKGVVNHCYRIAEKDSLTNRADAIDKITPLTGAENAERTIDAIIEGFTINKTKLVFSFELTYMDDKSLKIIF